MTKKSKGGTWDEVIARRQKEYADFTFDQVRALEVRLEDWLLTKGLDVRGGLEIISIEKESEHVEPTAYPYLAFYLYDGSNRPVEEIHFRCHITHSGVEDVVFQERT